MTSLNSKLGRASWKGVWGWALDVSSPDTKVTVEILLDDQVVGQVVARDSRPNLKILPPEQRNCGFQFLFPNGLSALSGHTVRARVVPGGRELEDSPYIVEPAPGLDPALERTVENALQVASAQANTQQDLDAPLRFVAAQLRHLLAVRKTMQEGDQAVLPSALAELNGRWSSILDAEGDTIPAFPEVGDTGGLARRILVIGDALRVMDDSARILLAHIASLVRLGAVVEFAAADFHPEFAPHVIEVERAGASYHRPPLSPSVEDVFRRNRGLYETVVIHRITNFEKYAALSRFYCPSAPVLFNVDSLFFVRMLRRAALQSWAVGTEKGEALRTREMMAAWQAQGVITCSHFEADLIRKGVPQANVHVVAWPVEAQPRTVAFEDRLGVAFIGDFQQHVDYDAATWMLEVLMPAVWAINPGVPCIVAGCNMPDTIRTLVRDRVRTVPLVSGDAADTEAILNSVRLTVATQRAGAGLPSKLLASLGAGVPCVGTSVAFEGLVVPSGLLDNIADDAQRLAARVCARHDDKDHNAANAEAGVRFMAEQFSPEEIDRQMGEAVGVAATIERTAGPRPSTS